MPLIKILDGIHVAPFNPFAGEGESDLFASYAPATLDRLTRAGISPGDFFRYREGVFMLAYNRSGSSTANSARMTTSMCWSGTTSTRR